MLFCYLSLIETEEEQLTFLHIYRKYRKQMYYVANRILKKHEAAEDAVQNALLGIATSIHHVPATDETAIRAYVLTAARNAALGVLKEEEKWGAYLDISDLQLPSATDTFRTVAESQDYEKLLELMSRLPLQYREVMLLRYVMELKPQEIGAALQRKTTTVQQQLARGKRALAALYAQEVKKNT